MTDILELAKRVEALDGPDREVDRAVRQIFGHAWDYAADWDRLNTSTGIKEINPVAKPYTASLDAAMTLIEKRQNVTSIMASARRYLAKKYALHCNHWPDSASLQHEYAKAITAAALRAKEANNG